MVIICNNNIIVKEYINKVVKFVWTSVNNNNSTLVFLSGISICILF